MAGILRLVNDGGGSQTQLTASGTTDRNLALPDADGILVVQATASGGGTGAYLARNSDSTEAERTAEGVIEFLSGIVISGVGSESVINRISDPGDGENKLFIRPNNDLNYQTFWDTGRAGFVQIIRAEDKISGLPGSVHTCQIIDNHSGVTDNHSIVFQVACINSEAAHDSRGYTYLLVNHAAPVFTASGAQIRGIVSALSTGVAPNSDVYNIGVAGNAPSYFNGSVAHYGVNFYPLTSTGLSLQVSKYLNPTAVTPPTAANDSYFQSCRSEVDLDNKGLRKAAHYTADGFTNNANCQSTIGYLCNSRFYSSITDENPNHNTLVKAIQISSRPYTGTGTGEHWGVYQSAGCPSYFGGGIQFDLTHSTSGTQEQLQLDYYERGTFTPTVTDVTSYAAQGQRGGYTRIGNQVYFQIFIRIAAITTSANAVLISGLPFTSSSSANTTAYGGCWISYGSWFVTPETTAEVKWHIAANSNRITAFGGTNQRANIATNNALWNWLDPQRVVIQGMYITDD